MANPGRITDYPEALRHRCSTDGCALERHSPNWGCLGELRGGVRPMDVDGVIERHGAFLWLEYKGPGATLSAGEWRTYTALAAQPNHTVLVITAHRPTMASILEGTKHGTPGTIQYMAGPTEALEETKSIELLLRAIVLGWLAKQEARHIAQQSG